MFTSVLKLDGVSDRDHRAGLSRLSEAHPLCRRSRAASEPEPLLCAAVGWAAAAANGQHDPTDGVRRGSHRCGVSRKLATTTWLANVVQDGNNGRRVGWDIARPMEATMNAYVILRRNGWRSPEDLQAAVARSAEVGDEEMSEDIRWIRSYVLDETRSSRSRTRSSFAPIPIRPPS